MDLSHIETAGPMRIKRDYFLEIILKKTNSQSNNNNNVKQIVNNTKLYYNFVENKFCKAADKNI